MTPKYKKIERYLLGLSPQIRGMVMSSGSTTYKSTRNLSYRLIKNELGHGTIYTKVKIPKSEIHKKKFSRGRQKQHKKQQAKKVYAITLNSTPSQQKGYVVMSR